MTRYDDIINLPHHTSVTHTPLPIATELRSSRLLLR